jgi:hypothetical protein
MSISRIADVNFVSASWAVAARSQIASKKRSFWAAARKALSGKGHGKGDFEITDEFPARFRPFADHALYGLQFPA